MATHFKITKRAVDQLQGDGAEKFYWDGDLPASGSASEARGASTMSRSSAPMAE